MIDAKAKCAIVDGLLAIQPNNDSRWSYALSVAQAKLNEIIEIAKRTSAGSIGTESKNEVIKTKRLHSE